MCVCVCVCACVCVQACVCMLICTTMSVLVYAWVCVCVCMHLCACMCVHAHLHYYVCASVCMSIRLSECLCVIPFSCSKNWWSDLKVSLYIFTKTSVVRSETRICNNRLLAESLNSQRRWHWVAGCTSWCEHMTGPQADGAHGLLHMPVWTTRKSLEVKAQVF